jgi:hypothetical protein
MAIDAELLECAERLFGRRRQGGSSGSAGGLLLAHAWTPRSVRQEIQLAIGRAPQVMVKVTGGGRGMAVVRAHLKYIDREGEGLIDQDGVRHEGGQARLALARAWASEGTPIQDQSDRSEAFNIMWSMPAGTEAQLVLAAVQGVARREFAEHRYVMALHTHQANPHVHLVVRAEPNGSARRLNPRKADLHRWRTEFALELRALGIEAAATRQAVRGDVRTYPRLWQLKAREERRSPAGALSPRARSETKPRSRLAAVQAWRDVAALLARSERIHGTAHWRRRSIGLSRDEPWTGKERLGCQNWCERRSDAGRSAERDSRAIVARTNSPASRGIDVRCRSAPDIVWPAP